MNSATFQKLNYIQLKAPLEENKLNAEAVFVSRTLGTVNTKVHRISIKKNRRWQRKKETK